MAEVAGAVAGAVGNIALAGAAISVVGTMYAMFEQVYNLIPWAGSAALGSAWAMLFSRFDPVLAMGGGLALGAFIYPALQIFTATSSGGKMPLPNPDDTANGMSTIGGLMAGGLLAGVTNLSLKTPAATLAALLIGGFLGNRYLGRGLTNFYIDIGFMQGLACKTNQAQAGCLRPCTKKQLASDYHTFLTTKGKICTTTKDNGVLGWCNQWKAWTDTCDWNKDPQNKPADTPPQEGRGVGVNPTPNCAYLSDYEVMGPPVFTQATCPPPSQYPSWTYPITEEAFRFYAGDERMKAWGVEFAGPGIARTTSSDPGSVGRFAQTQGSFKANGEWTCMYGDQPQGISSAARWYYGDSVPSPPPSASDWLPYRSVDLSNSLTKTAIKSVATPNTRQKIDAWGKRTICVPASLGTGPNGTKIAEWQPNYDLQPSGAEHSSFCPGKGQGGWPYPRVLQGNADPTQYACQPGPRTPPGNVKTIPK